MFVGPVFTREFTIAPRRLRVYVARSVYVGSLLGLMVIAWLMLTGTQLVRDVGDLARFGTIVFQILAPLQLVVAVFFSAVLAASAVSQEKDRRTLILLLLTNLSNSELVLGKLLASLLGMLVLLVAAAPLFMASILLGGISFSQVGQMGAVTLASVLVCGSLGSTVALWREKAFQSLTVTVMAIVLWVVFWEVVAAGVLGAEWAGLSCEAWAAGLSPWRAVLETTVPLAQPEPALGPLAHPVYLYMVVAAAGAVLINGVAIAMVRVWNPSREAQPREQEEPSRQKESIWGVEHDLAASARQEPAAPAAVRPAGAVARTRRVWDNPVLWREMRTWAYGRRILLIRLVYLLLFGMAAGGLIWMTHAGAAIGRGEGALALAPLFLLSLFLVNTQAVTSLTSERDARAMDLLLVTDLTAKEIVYGKLGGVVYNTKEMIVLPILLCGWLWWQGVLGTENLIFLTVGLLVLFAFAAMLGIHAGMNYFNSRTAVAVSLGTLFFLFVGMATCMRMMVAFSGSFQAQLQPFVAFTIGGGIGLYVALGARNPSTAIGVASFACPLATFYAITSFLLDKPMAVFLVTIVAYGFMTAAMLVPAVCEFDVATGRTTIED